VKVLLGSLEFHVYSSACWVFFKGFGKQLF